VSIVHGVELGRSTGKTRGEASEDAARLTLIALTSSARRMGD
jgi:hypothetical protein